jgi:predicted dehydrogenase
MARIGVIGCGVVADYGHLPAIIDTPGLELTALMDPDRDRLAQVASKFGDPPSFTNLEEFFAVGLDAVLISSPAWAHLENVQAAAKHRVHVLCEKPLAMTDAEAELAIEAMESSGKMLFTGFVYRFSPVALQIKRWVEEGVIGDIRSLRLIYIWDLHGQYEQQIDGEWIESPRWRGRMIEGGPMVDCGVHQIDLARWWLGEEVEHSSVAAAWVSDYEAPDHVYLHMDHHAGAHTMVEMSFTYGHTAKEPNPHFSYHLIGTGGVIRYDRDGYILEARTGEKTITVPGASEKNFHGMHAAFSEALRTGDPGHLPSGRDGLIATQLARSATDLAIKQRAEISSRVTVGGTRR